MIFENKAIGYNFIMINEIRSGKNISVCLIAKNEEAYIESCIQSVLPIASEIIVLDTGSTDKTKEICLGFNSPLNPLSCSNGKRGDLKNLSSSPSLPALRPGERGPGGELKLLETAWEDDFSKARNESIKYASGDWILYIDADEIIEIESETKFFAFLERNYLKNEPIIIEAKIGNYYTKKILDLRTVIFRNGFDIHFKQPVHEFLTSAADIKYIFCPYITIYIKRIREDDDIKVVMAKYISSINKMISSARASEGHPYYLLAECYKEINEHDKALEYFYKAYDIGEDIKADKKSFARLLINIIELLIDKKFYQQSYPFIDELLKLSTDFPDALFYKAYGKLREDELTEATELYLKILNLAKSRTDLNPYQLISKADSLIPEVKSELSRIYFIKGDKQKGLKYLSEAYFADLQNHYIAYFLLKYYLLEENLPMVLFHYQEINAELQAVEIEKLKIICKFPSDSSRYISSLLTFLAELEKLNIWLPQEQSEIKGKISLLQQKQVTLANPANTGLMVSACIIIDGEANFLENCLKSLGTIAGEVIFIDIGASETSREIAGRYGKVYRETFQGNYNQIREKFREHADHDWLLFIEPDEELSEKAQPELTGIKNEIVIYGRTAEIQSGDNPLHYSYRPVLIHKNFDVSLFNPFLKQLNITSNALKNFNNQIIQFYSMKNLKEPAAIQNEAAKNLKIILDTLNQKPDIYLFKYAADAYTELGEYDKALEFYFNSYNSFAQKKELRKTAFYCELLLAVVSLFVLKYQRFSDSLKFIEELLTIAPDYPDALFYQAYCHQKQANYHKAINVYDRLLNLLSDNYQNPYYLNSLEKELIPLVLLELNHCHTATANDLIAFHCLEKLFRISPNAFIVNIYLTKYYLQENNLAKALYHFNKANLNLSESERNYFKNIKSAGLSNAETEKLSSELLNYLKENE
jgi:glycosyltransferase involved in cell wall biosynthesis